MHVQHVLYDGGPHAAPMRTRHQRTTPVLAIPMQMQKADMHIRPSWSFIEMCHSLISGDMVAMVSCALSDSISTSQKLWCLELAVERP